MLDIIKIADTGTAIRFEVVYTDIYGLDEHHSVYLSRLILEITGRLLICRT